MDERSKKQQSSLEKEIGKHESQGISAGIIELYVYINIHIYIYINMYMCMNMYTSIPILKEIYHISEIFSWDGTMMVNWEKRLKIGKPPPQASLNYQFFGGFRQC